MKRAYVDLSEGQMHYRSCGSGPAVIMVHMSGSSSQEYERVGELLKDLFHVYAIDLLGFGGSDNSPRRYTLAEHAETVAAFMDALGIKQAYLVGNLVGSNILVHFALEHPERVLGLMLGQYCFDTDYAHFRARRDDPCFLPVSPVRDGSHLAEIWARAGKYDVPANFVDERALCLHQAGEHGEWLHLSLFEEPPFEELLPRLNVPTVVVEYGAFSEHEMEKHVVKMIPGAVLDVIEHATPYINRSDPKAFAEVFLKHFS